MQQDTIISLICSNALINYILDSFHLLNFETSTMVLCLYGFIFLKLIGGNDVRQRNRISKKQIGKHKRK